MINYQGYSQEQETLKDLQTSKKYFNNRATYVQLITPRKGVGPEGLNLALLQLPPASAVVSSTSTSTTIAAT